MSGPLLMLDTFPVLLGALREKPPGFLLFVPHAHGSEVRSLPLIITVLLRSRFAHALRSLVSQRKRRAAAHNRVVLGRRIRTRGVRQITHLGTGLQEGFWAGCWPPLSALCPC